MPYVHTLIDDLPQPHCANVGTTFFHEGINKMCWSSPSPLPSTKNPATAPAYPQQDNSFLICVFVGNFQQKLINYYNPSFFTEIITFFFSFFFCGPGDRPASVGLSMAPSSSICRRIKVLNELFMFENVQHSYCSIAFVHNWYAMYCACANHANPSNIFKKLPFLKLCIMCFCIK